MKNSKTVSPMFECLEPKIMLSAATEINYPEIFENSAVYVASVRDADLSADVYEPVQTNVESTGSIESIVPSTLLARVVGDYTNIKNYSYYDAVDECTYYAMGNGTNNDTKAIQHALATGDPIYFEKTDAWYSIDGALMYSGNRIVSDGATIKSSASEHILTIQDVDGLYIGDLNIEFIDVPTTEKRALQLIDCTNFIVERVTVVNAPYGIDVTNKYHDSENGVIRNCKAYNSSYNGFYVQSSKGIVLENCYARTSRVTSYAVENSTCIEVNNCTAEDGYMGLRIEDSAHIVAEGNTFRYCTTGARAYGPGSGSDLFTTDITFKSNVFYHCYKTVTVNPDDPYVNHTVEYVLATKMYVGDVLFENNIVIGNDESTLLTEDLSSNNVVFNTSVFDAQDTYAGSDTFDEDYRVLEEDSDYIYVTSDTGLPNDWLFYVNFSSGIDISEEKIMTMDFFWGSEEGYDYEYPTTPIVVNLYGNLDQTDFLCSIPLNNYFKNIALPCILHIPGEVTASTVKCIEVEKIHSDIDSEFLSISQIRQGLGSRVGYLHSFYHTTEDNGALNAVLDSNVFVDVDHDCVNNKLVEAYDYTKITGSGTTGTTAQRPASPELGWRYYDTELATTVYWDGNDWSEVNTYWLDNQVDGVIFDDEPVNLGNDPRVDLSHYTIEGWVVPTDDGVASRHIVQRRDGSANEGYLMQIWNDNDLYAYQSVGGNFYTVMVHNDFPHDGRAHHVAMTFDYNGTTSTLKLYIDGNLVDSASATGAPDAPSVETDILSGNGFEGSIGDLNFHTRTLSATEIEACYDRFLDREGAYWSFDEGTSDTAYDYSSFGSTSTTDNNPGTLTNMDTASCWVDGVEGKALDFDGVDDYVNFGNPAWLDSNDYTVEAWIKPDGSGYADRYIVERCDIMDDEGLLMLLYSDDNLYAYQSVNGNFYEIIVNTPFPHDGEYHHVAMTFNYDGTTSTLKLYLDGVLKDTGSATGSPDYSASIRDFKAGYNYEGIIDEIKYYTRTLTADEIKRSFDTEGKLYVAPEILTVGAAGTADYTSFADALADVSANETIQFVDNGHYTITQHSLTDEDKYEGITIETVKHNRATMNFSGTTTYAYGLLIGVSDVTIKNLIMQNTNNNRACVLYGDSNSTRAIIADVNFISESLGSTKYLVNTGPGWDISYCTFLGTGADSTSGKGIMVQTTGVTIDHCSFDDLGFAPIYNSVITASFSVTNSAFGAWYKTNSYRCAIYVAGTLTEDYNYSWGDGRNLVYGEVGSSIYSGGHSVKVDYYTDIFVEDTSLGEWDAHSNLYTAANDYTTVGAWQAA